MARFASALTQQVEECWVESRFAGADYEVVDVVAVVVVAICGAQVLDDSA